jgi:hypothetical protein
MKGFLVGICQNASRAGPAGSSQSILDRGFEEILHLVKQFGTQHLDLLINSKTYAIDQVGKQHSHVAFNLDQTGTSGSILPFLTDARERAYQLKSLCGRGLKHVILLLGLGDLYSPAGIQIALMESHQGESKGLYNKTSPPSALAGGLGEGRIGATNTSTTRYSGCEFHCQQ